MVVFRYVVLQCGSVASLAHYQPDQHRSQSILHVRTASNVVVGQSNIMAALPAQTYGIRSVHQSSGTIVEQPSNLATNAATVPKASAASNASEVSAVPRVVDATAGIQAGVNSRVPDSQCSARCSIILA